MRHKISKNAQALIEYTTVATLILVGILVMGPYVIRSINAFFRQMENDVEDSISEEMTQSNRLMPLPGCDCSSVNGLCGQDMCNSFQRRVTTSCTPPQCNEHIGLPFPLEPCVYDNACCNDWTMVMPVVCGILADPLVPGGCPNGFALWSRRCGASSTEYQCQFHAGCDFRCTGLASFATLCPGADVGLVSDMPVHHIGSETAACDGTLTPPVCPNLRKCEAYCGVSWLPRPINPVTGISNGCTCPANAKPAPAGGGPYCICDPAYISGGLGCCGGADQCFRDGCLDGDCTRIAY